MTALSDEAFSIRLPEGVDQLDQDQEHVDIEVGGAVRRIRLHDYADIFSIPGLYEELFARQLSCDSPRVLADLLATALREQGVDPAGLRALDFGAGNGMVGEELQRVGIGSIVGIDLLEEAKVAAERDRPDVYDAYHALDLTALTGEQHDELASHRPNCLSCASALGFGDVPVAAFKTAFDLVEDGGWIVFNIRDRFLHDADGGQFAKVIAKALDEKIIDKRAELTYEHRKNVSGEGLDYVAIVGQKHGELPTQA